MFHTKIHVKAKLDTDWSDWFEAMHLEDGPSDETILHGDLPDISAVYGVLSLLSSLGIPLISVTCQEKPNPGPLAP